MPIRSLLLVAALAAGDYLLWTWSSDGNSDTVALVSGLALALLLIALLWLIAVGVVRSLLQRALLAGSHDDDRRRAARRHAARRRADRGRRPAAGEARRAARRIRTPTQAAGEDGALFEERAMACSTPNPTSPPARSDRVAA